MNDLSNELNEDAKELIKELLRQETIDRMEPMVEEMVDME